MSDSTTSASARARAASASSGPVKPVLTWPSPPPRLTAEGGDPDAGRGQLLIAGIVLHGLPGRFPMDFSVDAQHQE
ncbi:hypothetical protein ACRAWF_44425 [Streptomyces sp. L7]